MVGENFEIFLSQMAKHALKLSTMTGEKFEIHFPQMAKMYLNDPPWLEKSLKFTCFKWLKMT